MYSLSFTSFFKQSRIKNIWSPPGIEPRTACLCFKWSWVLFPVATRYLLCLWKRENTSNYCCCYCYQWWASAWRLSELDFLYSLQGLVDDVWELPIDTILFIFNAVEWPVHLDLSVLQNITLELWGRHYKMQNCSSWYTIFPDLYS